MLTQNVFDGVCPPSSDAAAPGGRQPILLSSTGTTETSTGQLVPDHQYCIVVGNTPIRVTFRATTGTANAVATTDMLLVAGAQFKFIPWIVKSVNGSTPYGTTVVYAEAADGVSAYTATVFCAGN